MANDALLHETRQRLLNAEGEPVYAVGRDEFGRDQLLYDCLSLLADTCGARLWFPYDPSVKSTSIARWFADRLERYDRYYADFSAWRKPTVLAVFERVSDLTLEEVRFGRLLSRDRKLLILAGARKHGFLRGVDPARVLRLEQPYRAAFLPENELRGLTDTPLSALPRLFASGVTHTSESSPEIALRASGDKISIDAVVSDDVHLLIADELPLASARPYVVTTRLTRAFREQLATFEALINDPNVKESAFQHYFEHHEHFLAGYDYVRVVPQVVLHRDDGSSLKPDFMLQPCRSVFADLVELKLPMEELVVGTRDRKRFAAGVFSAIAQVREYRDYFDDSDARASTLRRYGFTAYRPEVTVIIGRQPDKVDDFKLRQLADDLPPYLRVLTYDHLLARMRRMAELLSR